MKKVRIPLAGSIVSRTATATGTRDQIFQNCFSYNITDPLTGGQRIITRKRQGFANSSTLSNIVSAQNGACIWHGKSSQPVFSFLKTGSATCGVYYHNGTQIGGDIANVASCTYLSDTSISGTANLYGIFTDSGTGAGEMWFYPDGGAWTQVTDSDFPSNIVSTAAEMDGYIFALTSSGRLHNSDLNSISAWSANNWIDASVSPDGAYALARTKNILAVFGYSGIQFFVNNGNPSGSPLVSLPNSAQMLGMKNSQAQPTVIGDDIYFSGAIVGAGSNGFFKLTGTEIQKISTPEVDKLMVSGTSFCMGAVYFLGYTHVFFRSITNGLILVYQPELNRWWKWKSQDSGETYSMALTRVFGYPGGIANYGSGYDGIVTSSFTAPTYTDYDQSQLNTFAYDSIIQTQALTFGTNNKKFWRYIKLIGEKQASTANVTVSFSDDDATNFTTAGTIDMSLGEPIALWGLGSSRSRVWKFLTTASIGVEFDAIEIGYDEGTN